VHCQDLHQRFKTNQVLPQADFEKGERDERGLPEGKAGKGPHQYRLEPWRQSGVRG
jgi:hypothetical protein